MREYVYYPDSFRPLALLTQTADGKQSFHYHCDPNGTPVRLTATDGDVVWESHDGVWGEAGERAAQKTDNPLRFQGQYLDAETGLHYNRYRYYDPQTAAYISQDPPGLAGGLNPYQYAPNPLMWVDPLGLKACGTGSAKQSAKNMPFADWIKAKAKGGNNTHVYFGYEDDKPVYVGISKDVDIRAGQHADRFDKLVRITEEPLNRGHARSIEQAIIHNNPHPGNSINSISPIRKLYSDAVSWGENWLNNNGISIKWPTS